jgi:hypothetical protein
MFFIEPALPKLRVSPPVGDGWLYEVKFNGYRDSDGAFVTHDPDRKFISLTWRCESGPTNRT